MLSFGIRFGEGFDRVTIYRLMQSIPKEYDYDLIVIGSNPGGVACARQARLAGKKTAIITWKNYSPSELSGYDEDLNEMAIALQVHDDGGVNNSKATSILFDSNTGSSVVESRPASTFSSSRKSAFSNTKSYRKVRQSRLDLSNELFKRGKQCRKLMHNATRLGDLVEDARNSGWRLTTTIPPLSINWNKMSEEVMDYVMKENWNLAAQLGNESVEIIEGFVTMEDNHTVKIQHTDTSESTFTAEIICLALPTECILPHDVPGARKFGINCDDFIRLNEPPGKTLIVGSHPDGLECAGILASARFPVTIVTTSKILKGCDSEISQMIIDDLKSKGVVFKEGIDLKTIEMSPDKKLVTTFIPVYEGSEIEISNQKTQELFDTVLFALGRRVYLRNLNVAKLGVQIDPENEKIKVDKNDQTAVPNIYAIGEVLADCPENFEISQLAGQLLGKRLFHDGKEFMDYCMIPEVVYTPTEYAWVGVSEDAALYRIGIDCVDVYYGYFVPLDFVVPPKRGECFSKVIVLKSSEEIIGLHIYGPEAAEIIQGFAAAIRAGLTFTNFQTIVGVTASKAQEILKLKEIRRMKEADEAVPLHT